MLSASRWMIWGPSSMEAASTSKTRLAPPTGHTAHIEVYALTATEGLNAPAALGQEHRKSVSFFVSGYAPAAAA